MNFDEKKEFDGRVSTAILMLTGGNDPDDPGDIRAAVSEVCNILSDLIEVVYQEGP